MADSAFAGGDYRVAAGEVGLRAFGRVYAGWAFSQNVLSRASPPRDRVRDLGRAAARLGARPPRVGRQRPACQAPDLAARGHQRQRALQQGSFERALERHPRPGQSSSPAPRISTSRPRTTPSKPNACRTQSCDPATRPGATAWRPRAVSTATSCVSSTGAYRSCWRGRADRTDSGIVACVRTPSAAPAAATSAQWHSAPRAGWSRAARLRRSIDLGTQGDVGVTFPHDDCGELSVQLVIPGRSGCDVSRHRGSVSSPHRQRGGDGFRQRTIGVRRPSDAVDPESFGDASMSLLARAEPIDADEVPVIDVAPLRDGTDPAGVGAALARVCDRGRLPLRPEPRGGCRPRREGAPRRARVLPAAGGGQARGRHQPVPPRVPRAGFHEDVRRRQGAISRRASTGASRSTASVRRRTP